MVDIMHNTPVAIFKCKKAVLAKGDQAVVEQIRRGNIMSVLCMFYSAHSHFFRADWMWLSESEPGGFSR